MFRRNLKSQSLLFKSHRLGNESIQSSIRVNHVQGKAQVRAVAGSTFITHQLRQSSSSSNADPSTSKTWDQLKSEIESQQKIEKEELEKDPSRQQSSDLASIIRMRMAENSTQSSSSQTQDSANQRKRKGSGRSNKRDDSESRTRSEEPESASSNPLFTLATKKDNYFTTSVASTESIGGIFQNAYVVPDRDAYSSNEFSDQSWLLISIPDFKKDFFKRSYFSSTLTYPQSVEFLVKISELITTGEDVGSKGLNRAKPKKLYLESNGRVKLEFGRILDFGFAKQMQRKKQIKQNHIDLLRWTKTGNEKDCLITESDVELAGEVEKLWSEFVEEKALEKEHRRNFNASQNPKAQALSASMGLSERSTSSKQDEIEEHTPVSINSDQVSKPKSQSMLRPGIKESALSSGLGIEEREENTPPVEKFRPVEIESSTSQSRDSLKHDKVKESAIAVGLGVKGRSKSDSAGIEESRPVEIGSGSQRDGLDSQKVKQSALETGLGIKDRNQRSKPIEESRSVEIGATSTYSQDQSGENQLKDGKVKESAIGSGLGINSRERASESKGIEESRPVEIKTQRSPNQDTNSISERSTKESALKAGMGLSERESSEETGKVEESRPVEIESDVKKRRDEMGLMSGNRSQKDVEVEEKAIGKGLGLGSDRGGKVEDKVEEMTPVKIGGEER